MTPFYKLHSGLFSEMCHMANDPTFKILTGISQNFVVIAEMAILEKLARADYSFRLPPGVS